MIRKNIAFSKHNVSVAYLTEVKTCAITLARVTTLRSYASVVVMMFGNLLQNIASNKIFHQRVGAAEYQ
ncbi:hypothetical protein T4D_6505 [Trichinella pseudospiralis]|uniref:Uncharacterized protein n=1 Tax=Trichinella pseudospiralis TaxID=6337 RepID=A0A0V1FLB5_TRIPS|nr:hypothetical protein T4D_6505 [Trichinella pseudospiralis]